MKASTLIGSTGEPCSRAPWWETIRCSMRVCRSSGNPSICRAASRTIFTPSVMWPIRLPRVEYEVAPSYVSSSSFPRSCSTARREQQVGVCTVGAAEQLADFGELHHVLRAARHDTRDARSALPARRAAASPCAPSIASAAPAPTGCRARATRPTSSCHISSTGRGEHGIHSSSRNPSSRSCAGFDAADLLEHELEPLAVPIAAPLDLHELPGLELLLEPRSRPRTPSRRSGPKRPAGRWRGTLLRRARS